MIGDNLNYDDVFLRNVTIAVLDTLEGEIFWSYKFSTGERRIEVPFYYSLTGDEKFILDTFVDDVVSTARLNELNTDIIPRGILTLNGFDMLTDQLANPNVFIRTQYEDKDEIKNHLARIRPIPISVKYELSILLNNDNDYFKCSQALMDTIGVYRYMAFQYNSFNINAVMQLPDSNQFERNREFNISSKNQIKLTSNFEVITYYPAYRRPDYMGLRSNEGPCDIPGWENSYTYDSFKDINQQNIIIPKKTKWYSNIHESNGNSSNTNNTDTDV